jgi:hypothetical protein
MPRVGRTQQRHHKGGAAFGYTRVLGYHPLLATRADTGEVLHARQRTGRAASGRGAERFVNELAGRVRRAGASGPLVLRADSGFWSAKVLAACRRNHIRFSITVRQTKTVGAAIAAIGEHAWVDIDYPDGGVAQVAETSHGGDRLIVRRTRLTGAQATLWPDWRCHAFVTDREGNAVTLDADHRRHAVCELAIRDLKDGAGLRHCPSGVFLANAAWLVVATQAHNLLRWVATIGLGSADLVVAKTPPASPAAPTRPADPLGPPSSAAPADRLAVGRAVPDRAGLPASHPAAHLILQRPPERCLRPAGRPPACLTDASSHRPWCSCHRSSSHRSPIPRADRAPALIPRHGRVHAIANHHHGCSYGLSTGRTGQNGVELSSDVAL